MAVPDENYIIKFKMVPENVPRIITPTMRRGAVSVAAAGAGSMASHLMSGLVGGAAGSKFQKIKNVKSSKKMAERVAVATFVNREIQKKLLQYRSKNEQLKLLQNKTADKIFSRKELEEAKANNQKMLEAVYSNREMSLKEKIAEVGAESENRIKVLNNEVKRLGEMSNRLVGEKLQTELKKDTSRYTGRFEANIATITATNQSSSIVQRRDSTSDIMRWVQENSTNFPMPMSTVNPGAEAIEPIKRMNIIQQLHRIKRGEMQSIDPRLFPQPTPEKQPGSLSLPEVKYEIDPEYIQNQIKYMERTR